jgi:acylphosphatase
MGPIASPLKRIGVLVTGRVQGVGYRYFTEDAANHFGLTGWVSNRFDRSVELEAQGEAADIDEFLARLRMGPPLAHVADLRVNDLPVEAGEKGFEVRY